MLKLLIGAAALLLSPAVNIGDATAAAISDSSTFSILAAKGKGRGPRSPGGSGCDDPRDLIEHPECGLKVDEPITLARNKPRVPGGSGCDDPGDLAEHPECRGTPGTPPPAGDTSGSGRSKPRTPGGSGCDDPEDILEHPECTGG